MTVPVMRIHPPRNITLTPKFIQLTFCYLLEKNDPPFRQAFFTFVFYSFYSTHRRVAYTYTFFWGSVCFTLWYVISSGYTLRFIVSHRCLGRSVKFFLSSVFTSRVLSTPSILIVVPLKYICSSPPCHLPRRPNTEPVLLTRL